MKLFVPISAIWLFILAILIILGSTKAIIIIKNEKNVRQGLDILNMTPTEVRLNGFARQGSSNEAKFFYTKSNNKPHCEREWSKNDTLAFKWPITINIITLKKTKRNNIDRWELFDVQGYKIDEQGNHRINIDCLQQMQREMIEYTHAREYEQIQKIEVNIRVKEETIQIHASLREDEKIRIVYRSIPVGTTMTMEGHHASMTIPRFNNRTNPEQIIFLYNKMLKSNNAYEDFVETNIRYEAYQIEAGEMQVRWLKPKEWTQGVEDEIYQLFETRLQTIRRNEAQEQDINKK